MKISFNKNGFTLVELLAVISILAILVAMVLPNVMEEYNKVKVETFVVDVQTVMDVAKSKYTMDSLSANSETIYYSSKEVAGLETKKLDIDTEQDYFIEMDRHGNFKRIVVYNAAYCYDVHSNYGSESIGLIDGVKSEGYNDRITKEDVSASQVWLSGNDLMEPETGTHETGEKYYVIYGCEGSKKVDLGKDNKSDIIINGEIADEDDIDYDNIGLNEFDVELIVNNGTGSQKKENIKYGTTVSWLVSPNEYYGLKGATITGDCTLNNNKVFLTVKGNTTCTLNMKEIYTCETGNLEYNESLGDICTIPKESAGTSYPYQCNCISYCAYTEPVYATRTEQYVCGTTQVCTEYRYSSGVCISYTTKPRYCTKQVTYQVGTRCVYANRCDTCYRTGTGECPTGWEQYSSTKCYKPATPITN